MLDRRLNAFRDDLADIRLKGKVEAASFAEAALARIAVPVADMKNAPSSRGGLDTQLLLGEAVRVFERRDGWAWVQAARDSYVGYVAEDALGAPATATHLVSAPRSFVYPADDMKAPRVGCLSLGCAVAVVGDSERRGTPYLRLADGTYMIAHHLRAIDEPVEDWVSVVETLERTPYLWGGASAFGIDCSGLVQLSLRMAGRMAPRDTDMQAAGLGEPLDREHLRRGDLVFWKGHVAIMLDAENIIHANGHSMMVSRERLADAVARIYYLYGQPTGFRRV